MIAVTAALIPPIAEATWRSGHSLKALLWWAVLVPAGAVVFFSASERVHAAKAGAEAERSALRNAATRAQAALTKSEASLATARAEANAARAQKQCGPICRTKLAAEAAAQADVEAARRELLSAESKATTDSPLQAPVWLLPAALDLVAFMAIWTGLSGRPKPVSKSRAKEASRCEAQTPRTRDDRCQGASRGSVPARGERQRRRSLHSSIGETGRDLSRGLDLSSSGDAEGLMTPVTVNSCSIWPAITALLGDQPCQKCGASHAYSTVEGRATTSTRCQVDRSAHPAPGGSVDGASHS